MGKYILFFLIWILSIGGGTLWAQSEDLSTSYSSESTFTTGESNSEGQEKWCENCGKLVPVNNRVAESTKNITESESTSKSGSEVGQH